MSFNWLTHENIIYSENIVEYLNKSVKVASFDLDHTLIKPKGKRTHPKDEEDFEFVFPNISDVLKKYNDLGFSIIIFSNQSSLNIKPDKKKIVLSRIQKLNDLVFQKYNIPVQVFISNSSDYCRKPNTGMMDFFLELHNIKLDKKSFYVGDAAGRIADKENKKDFACSDRMFALNCKINFLTPEQFFIKDDKRKFECDNSAKTLFMKEDKDGTLNNSYINWDLINQYDYIMLMGPPGSGKSTFSELLIKKHKFTDIISIDKLRIKTKTISELKKCIKDDTKRVIIDNNHSTIKSRKEYLDLVKDKEVLLIKFNIDKKQSFFLNNFRCKVNKTSRLSDVVIHSYFKYLTEPKIEEGFGDIMEIPFIPKFKNKIERKLFYQYF